MEKIQAKTVYYSRDLKRVENVTEIEFNPAGDILDAVGRFPGYVYKADGKEITVTGEQQATEFLNDALRDMAAKNARTVPADGILRSSVAKFVAAHRFSPKFAGIKDKAEQTAAILAEFAAIPYMVESLIGFDAAQRAEGAADDAADEKSDAATA